MAFSEVSRKDECSEMLQGTAQFQGRVKQGVYQIEGYSLGPENNESLYAAISQREPSNPARSEDGSGSEWKIWHHRLGHPDIPSPRRTLRAGAVAVNRPTAIQAGDFCVGCVRGKQNQANLSNEQLSNLFGGEVVHSDLCGPMSVESFFGCRYFISFINEASGFMKGRPVAQKIDTLLEFKRYVVWVERKYGCIIKRVHKDNEGECVAFRNYLNEGKIEHSTSPPYSKNQNGITELANRALFEIDRLMLEYAGLPRKFWAEAAVKAAEIRNRFLCPRDFTVSSIQFMTGTKPDISYFCTFGCLA